MKAKFYIGIITALLLAGSPMAAQFADDGFRNDNSGTVINNYYYDDYDYYFASRINRFHRSYAAFDYYSPVFTETYYYNYRPYSWGVSIYGGGGFGFGVGYSYRYPVYSYSLYDPYYGSSWGNDPFYYSYDPFLYSWYSPVVININFRNRWRPNYWGWHGYDRWYYGHNHWYNNYRPVYHTNNNHYYNTPSRYHSRDLPERKGTTEYNRSNSGGTSRREGAPAPGSRSSIDNTPAVRTRSAPAVRSQSTPAVRSQSTPANSSPSRSQVSRPSSSSKGSAVSGSRNSTPRSSGSSSRSSSSSSSSRSSSSSSSKSSRSSSERGSRR
ncbi:MAG: hypothetical protein V1903_08835 [Bacteroidota bacterium]